MSSELSRAAATLADLSRTLESGEQPELRIRRAAEQIRSLMRSDACAFLNAEAGAGLLPRLVVVPALTAAEEQRLGRRAQALLEVVRDRPAGEIPAVLDQPAGVPPDARAPRGRPHLAVPLIAVGEIVGMLLVERASEDYRDRELQLLAIGAAQLGAFLAILRAREEQRRSGAALAEALAATRAVDAHKAQFLNVLSHELRNPLAPLRNAVYVLDRADPMGENARRARAIIGRQVEHLARLVDDLLDSTRISTGKVHLQRARLDLAEVVRRTADDHRAVFQRQGVELTLRASSQPLWVDADETRVAQVVGNLLSNALKFTSAGGHVEVSAEREPPAAGVVRVRDDGVGMSPETLSHLFDPFSQGADTLHRSHAGLGLGLALAKGLVELHGGTIEARSDGLGRGAEFTIRIPLLAPGDPAGAGESPSRAPASTPRKVLLIDDNQDAAESLRDLLKVGGHTVEVAYDGPSGLALARATSPDVLVCDIGLPGMDGYAVARALRDLPELARTRLIALTGFGSAEDQQRALAAGFHRHLVKPVELAELEQVLAEVRPPAPGPDDLGRRR